MTTITFPRDYSFEASSIKLLHGYVGIYFIFLEELRIPYPFGPSRLVYIGMSEARQNSIGRRLQAHLSGQSGNLGIRNYATRHRMRFTTHSFELLREIGLDNLFEIESVFLKRFQTDLGSFPICNNQAGLVMDASNRELNPISVDWARFA